jgi:PIN domain nuclease of toxin-antitoxin system
VTDLDQERLAVLDASALLALLQEERGADEVEQVLDGALMSCVNLAEVLQKAEEHGAETEGLEHDLEALGIGFRPFDVEAARPTTEMWSRGTRLSLGDRACLALAEQVGGTAITTERRWGTLDLSVNVRVIQ